MFTHMQNALTLEKGWQIDIYIAVLNNLNAWMQLVASLEILPTDLH